MKKYIIQTRNTELTRTLRVPSLITGLKYSHWQNTHDNGESFEVSKKRCEDLIQNRGYHARNVRIVQVVCEFSSTVNVKEVEPHAE